MAFFDYIVSLSIRACVIIPLVVAVRQLIKNYPKKYSYILWLTVFAALVVKINVQGDIDTPISQMQHTMQNGYNSVMESYTEDVEVYYYNTEKYDIAIEQGMKPVTDGYTKCVVTSADKAYTAPQTVKKTVMPKVEFVWIAGIIVLMVIYIKSVLNILSAMRFATREKDNIYYSEYVNSPFVFGIIKPKIYLPYSITSNQAEYVIAHEKVHIKRFDYLIKPVCLFITFLHWFNPFVWVAFWLMTKDMELSCDETVIKAYSGDDKKDYCTALLQFALKDKPYKISAVMFGENDCSSRVKNILNFKQPKKIIAAFLGVIVLAMGVVVITEEKPTEEPQPDVPMFTHDIENEDSLPQQVQYTTVGINYFNDAVFVGDSSADVFRVYPRMENSVAEIANFVTLNNYTPAKFRDEIIRGETFTGTGLEHIKNINPDKIYIIMGTDALVFMNEKDFIYDYAEMISAIKDDLPNKDIYVCGVPLTTETASENRPIFKAENLAYVNSMLEQAAYNMGAYYLNLNEALADENGYLKAEYAGPDGIHINSYGYTPARDSIRTHIVVKNDDIVIKDVKQLPGNIAGWPHNGKKYPDFIWPAKDTMCRISADYGEENVHKYEEYNHQGIDIIGEPKSEIYAAAAGEVTTVREQNSYNGNYIVISHGNEMRTMYSHCAELRVKEGDTVEQGDIIALMGDNADAFVHFGVSKEYESVNPYEAFECYPAKCDECGEDVVVWVGDFTQWSAVEETDCVHGDMFGNDLIYERFYEHQYSCEKHCGYAVSQTLRETKKVCFGNLDITSRYESEKTDIYSFGWPTAGGVRITRGFTGQYPAHDGVDIAGPIGTEIYAAAEGKVVEADYTDVGEGVYIVIEHFNGVRTLYSHCSERYAELGDEVIKGQLIAAMGCTGNSTGSHLHFEIIDRNGTSLDPYKYW